MTEHDWVTRDAGVFVHQCASSPCLGALRAVDGIWLETIDGRRLIDLHGNTVHHVGHANPRLLAALKLQLETLPFSPRRYTNEPATSLAERLTRRFHGGRSRVLFATGGSDANEIALRLARVATGRSGIVALEGSYHGHGMGSLTLSSARLDERLGRQLPDVHHSTAYWDEAAGGADAMLADVRRLLREADGGIACLIAEPIRNNCILPPPGLWPEVAAACAAAGAKLIFDEIASGLGKTGRFFAHEHVGVTPDLVTLGKALGGGVLPIAAVLCAADLIDAPELDLGHYTHEKNPMTTRAALTTLDIIDEEGLVARAAALGAYVTSRAAALAQAPGGGWLAGVRGAGLLLALELSFPGLADPAEAMVRAAFQQGVSTTAKDRYAIGFSPPLTITEAEVDLVFERLGRAAAVLA